MLRQVGQVGIEMQRVTAVPLVDLGFSDEVTEVEPCAPLVARLERPEQQLVGAPVRADGELAHSRHGNATSPYGRGARRHERGRQRSLFLDQHRRGSPNRRESGCVAGRTDDSTRGLANGRVLRVTLDRQYWICELEGAGEAVVSSGERGRLTGAMLADLLGYDVANEEWPVWIDELASRLERDRR
jgi:hypothetical protein